MKVEFLQEAEEEMINASIFYEDHTSGLGERFINDIERSAQLLNEQPLIGERIDKDLRRILLRHFPFSLIYSAEKGLILIIAVAHQRRRPSYWRERLLP